MDTGLDAATLGSALARVLAAPPTPPLRAERLDGGYSWLTYAVTGADGRAVVVRVAPPGGTMEPYDPRVEDRALRAAAGSVPAPGVLAVVPDASLLGAPFSVQTRVPGRVLRLSAVSDPDERRAYRRAAATALGRLHRDGDPGVLGDARDVGEAYAVELERTVEHYRRAATGRHPGFEIGVRWLRSRRPRSGEPPCVCHGDFRFHNLAWTGVGRLGGVLDWERAWCGDPLADVAFTRLFSGWCSVADEAAAVYEEAAGRVVDPARVAYARRFEVVRSHTSGLRALRALADGRAQRSELFGIGEAGQAGLWALVRWLEDGPLEPFPDDAVPASDAEPDGLLPGERLAALRAQVPDGSPLARHLDALEEADARACADSVAALRAAPVPQDVADPLRRALATREPADAWARAHRVLAAAAARGGPDLVPGLLALGLRVTGRPSYLSGRIEA